MDKGEVYLYLFFFLVAVLAMGGLVYLDETQGKERRAFERELDVFCVDKGYEAAVSRFLKEFAGDEYVQCLKRIVNLDENGVAEFELIKDHFFFKEDD